VAVSFVSVKLVHAVPEIKYITVYDLTAIYKFITEEVQRNV